MKFVRAPQAVFELKGPAPQGAGGLKLYIERGIGEFPQSRPARGGWIEIPHYLKRFSEQWSRPARGGWIEIKAHARGREGAVVPPRKGRVD